MSRAPRARAVLGLARDRLLGRDGQEPLARRPPMRSHARPESISVGPRPRALRPRPHAAQVVVRTRNVAQPLNAPVFLRSRAHTLVVLCFDGSSLTPRLETSPTHPVFRRCPLQGPWRFGCGLHVVVCGCASALPPAWRTLKPQREALRPRLHASDGVPRSMRAAKGAGVSEFFGLVMGRAPLRRTSCSGCEKALRGWHDPGRSLAAAWSRERQAL